MIFTVTVHMTKTDKFKPSTLTKINLNFQGYAVIFCMLYKVSKKRNKNKIKCINCLLMKLLGSASLLLVPM